MEVIKLNDIDKLKKHQTDKRGKSIIKGTSSDYREDGYTNMLNKFGTSQDNSTAYEFEVEDTAIDMELTGLYEGNGLFAKIIDRPSEEAVKHGFDINYGDTTIAEYVEDRMDELEYEDKFATAQKWARLYGGAIIVMLVDDGRGLEEPINWDDVRGISELRVFERSVVQPDYTSLYAFNFEDTINDDKPFGQPEYYQVSSLYGYFRVHYTRCLVFRNGRLPERTTNALYRYWGIPEYVKLKRALRETITSHGNGTKLLERSAQGIYKMKNLANMLATPDGEDKVLQRLQIIDMARNILNSIAIDNEGEDYDFKTLQMAGVKDVLDATCNMLSAVTDIPQTILFGRSPAGENSTGESDLENYYNMVERIQKMNMKANSRTVIDLILKEGKFKGKIKEIPTYKVKFASLWSMTESEKADVDQKKATTKQINAQTTQVYVDIQALDPSEVRKQLAESGEYDIQDTLPEDEFNLPDDLLDILGVEHQNKSPVNADEEDVSAVAVIVINDGKLLVGNRSGGEGLCSPGGKIEQNETLEEASKREALEEFNINIHNLIPIGVNKASSDLYQNTMVYLCTDFTGKPKPDGDEITSVEWLSLYELDNEHIFPPFGEAVNILMDELNFNKKSYKPLTKSEPKRIIKIQKNNTNNRACTDADTECKAKDPSKCSVHGKRGGGKVDSETKKKYNDKLVGLKMACGVTVKSISQHAMKRLVQRNVSEDMAEDVILNASITYPGNIPDTICQQKDNIRVVINEKTGNIVTVVDLNEEETR